MELALWLAFFGVIVWAAVKLVGLGRDSKSADDAEQRGRDMAEAARIRDAVARDDRDSRERLRDWER